MNNVVVLVSGMMLCCVLLKVVRRLNLDLLVVLQGSCYPIDG